MVKIHTPNFSLRQICDSGQCFRMKEEADGSYSLIAGGRFLRIEQEGAEITFDCSDKEYKEVWKEYFDLETDYTRYILAIDSEDSYLQTAFAFSACTCWMLFLWIHILLKCWRNTIRKDSHLKSIRDFRGCCNSIYFILI